jgi:hypothetical protein
MIRYQSARTCNVDSFGQERKAILRRYVPEDPRVRGSFLFVAYCPAVGKGSRGLPAHAKISTDLAKEMVQISSRYSPPSYILSFMVHVARARTISHPHETEF